MSRKNQIFPVAAFSAALLICLLACAFYNGSHAVPDPVPSEDEPDYSFLELSDHDRMTEATDPVFIELSDGILEIGHGGDYHLSGSMNGMIHINARGRKVHLIFDGVDIESDHGPAIYCENADRLVITLADESDNRISDSGCYEDYENTGACLFSACDLSFNGGGMLSVYGRYKDAIHSLDVIRIIGGFFQIKSKGNGLQGNDGILITGGIFRASAAKDSFRSTKKGERGRGDIIITGGDFTTVSGRYSFAASAADLYMSNCTVRDKSAGGSYRVGGNVLIGEGCI